MFAECSTPLVHAHATKPTRSGESHLNNATVVTEDLARLQRVDSLGGCADVPEADLGIVGPGQQVPLQKRAPCKAIPGQVRARSGLGHFHAGGKGKEVIYVWQTQPPFTHGVRIWLVQGCRVRKHFGLDLTGHSKRVGTAGNGRKFVDMCVDKCMRQHRHDRHSVHNLV